MTIDERLCGVKKEVFFVSFIKAGFITGESVAEPEWREEKGTHVRGEFNESQFNFPPIIHTAIPYPTDVANRGSHQARYGPSAPPATYTYTFDPDSMFSFVDRDGGGRFPNRTKYHLMEWSHPSGN